MMADTDPAHHGFLKKEEVIDLLVTLLRDIQRDEAASCHYPIKSLKILGVTPDKTVGDLAKKCLSIDSLDDRLRVLNRGQG